MRCPGRRSMAEAKTGIRRTLAHPALYSGVQWLLGADAVRKTFVIEYLKPVEGERMLDLGCGPGELLLSLPATAEYVGVDLSPAYIEAARRRFSGRGRFAVMDARAITPDALGHFDAVASVGLLHHLDDPDVVRMLEAVGEVLGADGRFLSLDPGFADGQARSARWLMGRDRGRNIRSLGGYERLVGECFEQVTGWVRHDLARVPYTHVVVEGRRPRRSDQSSSL
jgi:SAM-dependent methyltransferase